MAYGTSVSPMLRIKRSTQSGSKAMANAYAAVYSESSSQPWIFGGAVIDLSNMVAGDIVNVRLRKTMAAGGAWIILDELTYLNAQPAGHPCLYIEGMANLYGLEISMRQTAGVLLAINTEFYDAKRVGLE